MHLTKKLSVIAQGENIKLSNIGAEMEDIQVGDDGFSRNGLRLERRGSFIYLFYSFLSVKWDLETGAWYITLTQDNEKVVPRGLCGNFNKDPEGK